jgi:2',3'-cyclic-nucleotide 2'-phosphodiesterase (5'-nucleotidase family)
MMKTTHCILPGRLNRFFGGRAATLLLAAALVSATALLPGCGSSISNNNNAGIPLEILWTNDTHGYFLPVYHAEFEEISTYAQTAATEGKVGGYAQIVSLVKYQKAQPGNTNVLFLDGGDTFDGSPVAQLTRGAAVVPVLNAMGFDAMVPGNRDFAFSKADFLSVTSKLTFPIVAANLQDATTGVHVFPRYVIKQTPQLKIALIGLTSPLAGGTTGFKVQGGSPTTPGGFQIEDEISALAAQIRATDNPDLVVAISHFGYVQDQKFASRSTGIDVIVGAHTHHNIYDAPVVANKDGSRQVVVVQAGSHGKFLGKLDLVVKEKKVASYKNELIRVVASELTKRNITPDATVLGLAQAAYAPFQAMLDEVIGASTSVLERRGDVQSTMSNFLADATSSIFGVDVSNHFGIRYGSTIIPGPVTVGDVWNMVSPNIGNNGMYVLTQTGTQIKATLNSGLNVEYGADIYNWGGGDVSRFNTRVKYTYKVNAADNQHIVDLKVITAAGETVQLTKNGVDDAVAMARVFTFAATSGAATAQVPNTTAVDEIVKYIKTKGTISSKIDDRAVRVD